jgi:hypothetical protein
VWQLKCSGSALKSFIIAGYYVRFSPEGSALGVRLDPKHFSSLHTRSRINQRFLRYCKG